MTSVSLCICEQLETRKPSVSCFMFRVYRYKHDDLKLKHAKTIKNLNKHEKIENSIEH